MRFSHSLTMPAGMPTTVVYTADCVKWEWFQPLWEDFGYRLYCDPFVGFQVQELSNEFGPSDVTIVDYTCTPFHLHFTSPSQPGLNLFFDDP